MISNIKNVFWEAYENGGRIFRLAVYDLNLSNKGMVLGFYWNFLNPIFQILVYWFLVVIGLRAGNEVDGYPYLIWLSAGIIPWLFISRSISSAASSINSYSGVITKMNFPISIIPPIKVLSEFLEHLLAMIVLLLFFALSGVHLHWMILQIIYYFICSVAILIAIGYATSAIYILIRDFKELLSTVIRLLFFLTPVLWSDSRLEGLERLLVRLNPFYYLITGYRNSLLFGTPFYYDVWGTVYFWGVTLVVFVIGCNIHVHFRKKFMDLL